ncbi:alpha/beta hydrolase [Lysobacter korlensis]|uniref:Alpha/beta hydrolase n=1 Tax=Lysobacter korlensis TaxID=553636 RepID=A0ABV6RM75_9GAMM
MAGAPTDPAGPRAGGVLGAAAVVGIGVAGLAAVAAGTLALTTVLVARTLITPPRRRVEDTRVLAFDGSAVVLQRTPDATLAGEYSLWFDGGRGHARLGEVLSHTDDTVTRRVLGVDFGELSRARRGRLGGWFYLGPRELGFPYSHVEIPTTVGNAPAWQIPAAEDTGRWVIQVHGRAVQRSEGLRAVPVFREHGYTSLLISYRNDGDAPPSEDGRYALGDAEWLDVEAAIRFALDSGARDIVLMGWSMGGAIVLQTITRSKLAHAVRGVVLESPVVEWRTALAFQAATMRLPRVVQDGVLALIASPFARRLTGQHRPIDLARLDLVRRASILTLPILLLHSADDGFVPVDASRRLAAARPDLVRFEEFRQARHTKLWNHDPDRWNAVIRDWLGSLSVRSPEVSARSLPASGSTSPTRHR